MQSNGDPLFYENASSDFPPSLDLDWMTPGFVLDDEFNTDELLSLSMSSTSLLGGDSGMLINAPSYDGTLFQAQCIAPVAEAGSVNGASVPSFFDIPAPSELSPITSDYSNWPASGMELTYYYPQQLTHNPLPQSSTPTPFSNTLLLDAPLLNDFITATSKFLYGRPLPITPSTPPVPSAYLNYIQTTFTSTILAYFHNASCAGLSSADHLNYKSPFYRPNTNVGEDSQALLVR
jgi:hypothetical protein